MFYIKTKISGDIELKIPLCEDEIYTGCPRCGKELQLDSVDLADIIKEQALSSTSVYCEECSKLIKCDTTTN